MIISIIKLFIFVDYLLKLLTSLFFIDIIHQVDELIVFIGF
jgi:hypothetical protein